MPDARVEAGPTPVVCGADSKVCTGTCVSSADPAHGCGAAACDPCSFANAVAACDATGACALGPCLTGYADCDANASNGCETRLDDDTSNCGACGHVCALANATPKCSGGVCAIASCASGYGDCDSDPSDGCEVATTSDVTHCGSCTTPCPTVANTTFACVSSACAIAACAPSTLACNAPIDGCECAVPNATVACTPPSPDGSEDGGADASSDGGQADAGPTDARGLAADRRGDVDPQLLLRPVHGPLRGLRRRPHERVRERRT